MRSGFLAMLFLPWVLQAQPTARVFIDSADAGQARLATSINEMLFDSPTLRSLLAVEVFDINGVAPDFSGGIHYTRDRGGEMISRYRPPALPFLICLNGQRETLRLRLENKEQLCLCTQGC